MKYLLVLVLSGFTLFSIQANELQDLASKVQENYLSVFQKFGGANFVAGVSCLKSTGEAVTYDVIDNYSESELVSCLRVDNLKKRKYKALRTMLPQGGIIKLDGVFVNFSYANFGNEYDSIDADEYVGYEEEVNALEMVDSAFLNGDDYHSKVVRQYMNFLVQLKGVYGISKGYCDTYNDEYERYAYGDLEECVFVDLYEPTDYINVMKVIGDSKDYIQLDQVVFYFNYLY